MWKRVLYIILGLLVALIIIAETLSKGFGKELVRFTQSEQVEIALKSAFKQ
jgi:hypothetical protein